MERLYNIIQKILNRKLKLALTINFDGKGTFQLEYKFGSETGEKLFTDF